MTGDTTDRGPLRRKPEAVVIPIALWERMEIIAEQAVLDADPEIQERVRRYLDGPSRAVKLKLPPRDR